MVAAHSRWRAVAETSDLASVVGPRVRFLCLDADETHVVLGANTGSLYVFARRRANTYRLPVFAPSTTCVSSASRHRKRTRGPTTLARSDVSATARQREWAATIVLGSVAPLARHASDDPRVGGPRLGSAVARLRDAPSRRAWSYLEPIAAGPRAEATWGMRMA